MVINANKMVCFAKFKHFDFDVNVICRNLAH
jgi:hypothetical protein